MKNIVIDTLGCKVNQYESQAMREILESNGYKVVDTVKDADIYFLNTCVVTEVAEKESSAKINRAKRENPRISIAVAGCMASTPDAKDLKGADFLIDNFSKEKILEILDGNKKTVELKVSGFHNHTRAFVKIEDGCEDFCSYCKVPYVRGKVISRPIKDILNEVERLVKNSYKEVVLTGINLGCYGKELKNKPSLVDVVKEVLNVKGLGRVRISSIEPNYVSEGIINLMAGEKKVCRHLHIPLQSGDDAVLKRMGRGYFTKDYENLLGFVRRKVEDICISTDVIVGFPGESEEDFNGTCKFVEKMEFLKVHIFTYSDRIGTSSFRFTSKISDEVKKARYDRLKEICDKKSKEVISRFIGRELEVLVESLKDTKTNFYKGFSSNYIRIFLENAKENSINKFVKCRIKNVGDYVLGMVV